MFACLAKIVGQLAALDILCGPHNGGCASLTQRFKSVDDQSCGLTHIAVGGEPAKAEPNGRIGIALTKPQSAKDMRRLGDARSASGSGGGREPRLNRA